MTDIPQLLAKQVRSHPFPLMFATISGAHLYGFPSPDSDYDLRGAHLLPLADVVGLKEGQETVERSEIDEGVEIDLVTHDVRKFFLMVLKKNGYVLEQIFSPLVVATSPAHEELKVIAAGCITRHHVHHYLGFAATQWKLFRKEEPPRVKPLLYVYRVLLTGIHLMRTGVVEANLRTLNGEARLSHIDELVQRKLAGPEQGTISAADLRFHESEVERLTNRLRTTYDESSLPEAPSGQEALNALLVRLRLGEFTDSQIGRLSRLQN